MAEIRDIADAQSHRELCRTLLDILAGWELTPEEQRRLLGLPPMSAREWRRLTAGHASLPEDPDTLLRIHHLLSIYRALRSLFPHSSQSADLYVTTPLPALGGRSPLDIMLDDDQRGMKNLLQHLEGRSPLDFD